MQVENKNSKLNIVILGARGMLGTDLAREATRRGFRVQGFDLPDFDITDPQQVEDILPGTGVIVNCAAYTNVEKAESEVELANQVNGYAVGRMAQLAARHDIPVLHISTDFVFEGTKETSYVETDTPNPVSIYGSSKLLGEKLLTESGCRNCIVRVQWTYGKHGVNFVTKITEAAKIREELKVVDDQIGSPTHTGEVANVLCDMLTMETFPEGLYHCAAGGYTSRFEMTCFLFDLLGIRTKVRPCKTADFKTAAQRPLNSRFECTKMEALLGRKMPSWQTMLTHYIAAEGMDNA